MYYEDIKKDSDFHKWLNYEPLDGQYTRYAKHNTNIIATGHKIVDVYYAFTSARFSFINANAQNFGDITNDDELAKKNAKAHFLVCALLEYGLCLDLLWQVIWAFIQKPSLDMLVKNNYMKIEKKCNQKIVYKQLDSLIRKGKTEFEDHKNLLDRIDKDKDIKRLRKIYNYLKHSGTICFEEFRTDLNYLLVKINGEKIPTIRYSNYTFENIEKILYKYHFKFETYFNEVIEQLVPSDYLKNKVTLKNYLSVALAIKKTQDKYKK